MFALLWNIRTLGIYCAMSSSSTVVVVLVVLVVIGGGGGGGVDLNCPVIF